MGIKNLTSVISDNAPSAIKNLEIKAFFGRKVAIDASMSLYQFLIAVRQQDGQQLQSETGETTSHLMGMFYRTLRIVDNGIKPLYVFDGAPPKLKSGELAKRIARNAQASVDAAEARETGTTEDVDKFSRRTVRVTRQHNEEAKLLLKLMGIPYVEAPCEAEACCARLAREGKVYAAASEDMDTLCFDAPVLLRHLTFSEARKEPISEIILSKALEGLAMSMDQFIDMCILLGCDYCDPIRGIGPKKALELIREYGTIEKILEHLKTTKYDVPDDWPFADARELFKNPDVDPWTRVGMSPLEEDLRRKMALPKNQDITKPPESPEVKPENGDEGKDDVADEGPALQTTTDGTAGSEVRISEQEQDTEVAADADDSIDPYSQPVKPKGFSASQNPDLLRQRQHMADCNPEWTEPDVEGLVAFLVHEKGFAEERVRSGAERLKKGVKQKQQGRLDGFFKAQPKSPSSSSPASKRKPDSKKDDPKKKLKKK
ncbi:Elongation of fatty acids protein 2 [Savitreella phatthalungensis]